VSKTAAKERIRIGQAAEVLELSTYKLRALHKQGKLSGEKDDSGVLTFTLADLYAFNREQTARRADTVLGLITQKDAAEYLGRNKRTITRWISEGLLVADKLGRVPRSSIERLAAEKKVMEEVVRNHDMVPTDQVLSEYGIGIPRLYELREQGAIVPMKIRGDRKLYYSRETLDEVLQIAKTPAVERTEIVGGNVKTRRRKKSA